MHSDSSPRRIRPLVLAAVLALLLAGCTASAVSTHPQRPHSSPAASVAPQSPAPSASPANTPKPLPKRFWGAVLPFTHEFAAQTRRTTWHKGCPVGLRDLRLLTLRYWGFDGEVHQGPMVVNASVAHRIVWVFRQLFRAHFRIHDMHLANRYRPGVRDDRRSKADYTNGFNCRPVVTARGPSPWWSMHASGLAIDINPIENPYVTTEGRVYDVWSKPYRDRSLHRHGMVRPGGVVVRAFSAIGWKWGGYWPGDKDYMHFSANGH